MRSPKLDEWLSSETIQEGIRATLDRNYVDLDPTFTSSVDEDFDSRLAGVSKKNFNHTYLEWIHYCADKRETVRIFKEIINIGHILSVILNLDFVYKIFIENNGKTISR